jgi:hypothetical protein
VLGEEVYLMNNYPTPQEKQRLIENFKQRLKSRASQQNELKKESTYIDIEDLLKPITI